MSASPISKKNQSMISSSFLNTTNPEIFHTHPRPGGVLHINESDFSTSTKIGEENLLPPKDFKLSFIDNVSKEYRVQTALDETRSIDSEDATVPNPVKDAMYMLGVTISGIIMMAANHPNIPQEYYKWAVDCLECIRDDFGNHPPNVQGILNHIKKVNPQMRGAASVLSGGIAAGEGGPPGDTEGAEAAEPEAPEGGEVEAGQEGEEAQAGQEGEEAQAAPEGQEGEQTVRTVTKVQLGGDSGADQ